jgi:hypothetical protein
MQTGARIEPARGRSRREKTGTYPDLALLAEFHREGETIGSSHYYITIDDGVPSLVRWQKQRSGVHLHEEMDHKSYAITDEDLHDAMRQDAFSDEESGICRISDHIANKLRVIYGV